MNKSNVLLGVFVTVITAAATVVFSKTSESHRNAIETNYNYNVSQTWILPEVLNEISAIVWVDQSTLACVQDELGVIYIYDLVKKSIIEEITFSGNGDYEGIALHNNDMFVMQSDGLLYEIKDWRTIDKTVSSYHTGFKSSNNMESLAYSVKGNVLLTIPKDKDASRDYKGIYEISLQSKKADINAPVFKIDMNEEALKVYKNKNISKTFNPSEVAIHPKTNEIYVLEGKKPKLLILDATGNVKRIFKLDVLDFPQPEGMTFSDNGDLYISNEAVNGPANIHLVELKDF